MIITQNENGEFVQAYTEEDLRKELSDACFAHKTAYLNNKIAQDRLSESKYEYEKTLRTRQELAKKKEEALKKLSILLTAKANENKKH